MRGNNLALFLDAFNEITPPGMPPFAQNQGPQYAPLNTGLEKLLKHYGIGIKKLNVGETWTFFIWLKCASAASLFIRLGEKDSEGNMESILLKTKENEMK